MKRLGLLRHAKSDWDDVTLRDYDRGLNGRGRRGAALIGAHIAAQPVKWDFALASPAERVRRTLDASGLDLTVRFDERAYLADAAMLVELVKEFGDGAGAILLVAHNPGLQELVFRLVDPAGENRLLDEAAEKFPTAAFALLELDIANWADISAGCGTLVHFARPRDLDPSLGPQTAR